MNTKPLKDFRGYVYPPARAAKVAIEEFERRNAGKDALDWGIAAMDKRIVPAVPGDLITILGRPGMGKTLTMIHLAKRFSGLLQGEKDVVVYATWETLVEEFVGILSSSQSGYSLEDIARGRADLVQIKKALVSILGNGIVIFGQSMENRNNLETPTLLELDQALTYLREEGYNIRAVLIDYAQAIPGLGKRFSDTESSKTIAISENIVFCKTLGKKHGTPVFLGAQARRDVDDYGGVKFPQMHDGQWTSTLEQASDKIFSITMPAKYMRVGDEIKIRTKESSWIYRVGEMTFGIKMLKQRFGPVGSADTWILLFDPKNLVVTEHPVDGEEYDDDEDILT